MALALAMAAASTAGAGPASKPPARPRAAPPAFSADYQLSRDGLRVGTATISLEYPTPGHYVYRAFTRPTRLTAWFRDDRLRERSEGTVDADGPRPDDYRFDHTGSDSERHARLRFDWQRDRVENSVAGHTWHMDIPPDTLDKLVVQLAVMMDLDDGRAPLRYPIADGGKLKVYRFKVVNREPVDTPAGRFVTVKVRRLRADRDRITYLWCAPALHYLPVKIERREPGDDTVYRSVLESVSAGLKQ